MAGLEGFTPLSIDLNGDDAWPELRDKEFGAGMATHVAVLPNGTSGGKPSVAIRGKLDDGSEAVEMRGGHVVEEPVKPWWDDRPRSPLAKAECLLFELWFLAVPACLLGLLVAPWLGIVLGCAVLPLLDWRAGRG